MISPLINSIVIAAFGFFIAVFTVIGYFVMPEDLESNYGNKIKQGWRNIFSTSLQKAEEGRNWAKTKKGRFATISFCALILILILVIKISPVRMNWLVFFIAFVTGYVIFYYIFQLAKAGKFNWLEKYLKTKDTNPL